MQLLFENIVTVIAVCVLLAVLLLGFDIAILFGIFYWTGFVILKAITLGRARLAPFSTVRLGSSSIGDEHRGRSVDWNSNLHMSNRPTIKGDSVCWVGIFVYILVGIVASVAVSSGL